MQPMDSDPLSSTSTMPDGSLPVGESNIFGIPPPPQQQPISKKARQLGIIPPQGLGSANLQPGPRVFAPPPLPPPSLPQALSSTSLQSSSQVFGTQVVAPPVMPASLQNTLTRPQLGPSAVPQFGPTQVPQPFVFLPEATSLPEALGPPMSSDIARSFSGPTQDRGYLARSVRSTEDDKPLLNADNVPGRGQFYGATGRPLDEVTQSTYINPPNDDWRDQVIGSQKDLPGKGKKYRYGFYNSSTTRYCGSCSIYVLLPWMIFTVIICALVFTYHRYAVSVWFVVFIFLAIAMSFAVLGIKNQRQGDGFRFGVLGALCAFATFSGCLVGLWGYHRIAAQYWLVEESRTYTNVLPGEPAVGHSDAGTLIFSTESRVDLGRVVGYKTAGIVYCVAPILKPGELTSRVEYFAAGTDCCHSRSGFSCGNAWDRNARAGFVLPEALPSNSALFPGEREQYLKAAVESASVYGLLLGEEPLFMTWVHDTSEGHEERWHRILIFVFAASGIYFIFSLICASINYCLQRHARQKNIDAGLEQGLGPRGVH